MNVALTDIEITQQYPFQPLHSIVLTLVLIIGQGYFDAEHGGELVKSTEAIIAISTTASSKKKNESLCFLSAHFSAGLVTSSVSQRPEPRAGIKKHRARSVYYQLYILYAMRRHKHPDKEAQVTQPPEGYF